MDLKCKNSSENGDNNICRDATKKTNSLFTKTRQRLEKIEVNKNLNRFITFFTLSVIATLPFTVLPQTQMLIQNTEAFDWSVIKDNIDGVRDESNANDEDNSIAMADETDINNNKQDNNNNINNSPSSGTNIQNEFNSVKSNGNGNNILTQSSSNPSLTSASASSLSSESLSSASSNEVYGDFNGDGFDDLAIGVPFEDVGTITDAGAVNVIYGSGSGLSATLAHVDQVWTQDSANIDDAVQQGDRFGSSLTAADFNGDGKDDLAVGVPGENLGTITDAGAVNVIYGSGSGLSATLAHTDQFLTQDNANIDNNAEQDDFFGGSLTAADFNGDGKDDLAIGVPGENVGTITDAGAVNVIYGSSDGLSATLAHADQYWTQDSADIDDGAEASDIFGRSLTAADFNGDGKDDLAVGVLHENLETITDAGAVNVIYGSSSGLSATLAHADQFWTQDSANIDNSAEQADEFGSSLTAADFNADGRDDLAVGVPDENVGSIVDAGGVEVIYGSSSGLSATSPLADNFWTQDSANIDGQAEAGDGFGSSLAAADFNGDGKDDLAIGVPGKDLVTLTDAGAVNVIYGSSSGLSATLAHADQFWTQDSADIDDQIEAGDAFGGSLTAADFNADGKDDLAIGVPLEDLGVIGDAGAVNVIYGSSSGLSDTLAHADQVWTQDSANIDGGAEADDEFGLALG